MIKFFRKTRQNLLMENKTGKYFKYAIGEIILVVIGILIALSINNWNELKKQRNEAQTFIKRLSEEVGQNIEVTNREILLEQDQVEKTKSLLEMFSLPQDKINSRAIDSLIFAIMSSNSIDIKTGTLEEGLNTGQVSLLSNSDLKQKLYSLPAVFEEIKRLETLESEDINDNMVPYLYDNMNFKNMDNAFSEFSKTLGPSKFKTIENRRLLNSLKFENLVDNRFYNTNQSLENYKDLLTNLKSIEKLLDEPFND
jgi:hypothetical protein|tara:strand:- start:1567 stop:2328 length:762 start_codon:yes stop_codon:yes gene_type:complete